MIVELRPVSTGKKGASGWYVNSLSITKLNPPVSVHAPAAIDTEIKSGAQDITKPNAKEVVKPDLKEPVKPGLKGATQPDLKEITKPDVNGTNNTAVLAPQIQQTNPPVNNKIVDSTPKQVEQGIQAAFARDLKANVKLRSGPGVEYQSIYEVKPNKHVFIIGKENGWYRVKIDDKEGFIFAGLISNHKNSGYGYKSTLIKQNCTVKDDQQHLIANIMRGEHLIILAGPRSNRYKIMLSDGKIGYVNRDAIDGTPTPTESPPPFVP